MKTLTVKILAPTLLALLGAMLLLGTVLIMQMSASISRQVEKDAEHLTAFVSAVSLPYVTNYDLTALGGFVKEITREGNVGYAEFFGADGQSLTADVATPPGDTQALTIYTHNIVDASGKPVAHFKLGMRRDAITAARRTAFVSVALVVALVLAGVSLCIMLVVRRAVAPAQTMRALLAELAHGDLTLAAKAGGDDEIGQMADSLNLAVSALNGALVKVGTHAHSVNEAAGEIAVAVGSHAATSSEMAATMVEITSSMEELSATSTHIAEHSKSVVEIANQTWESSKRGSQAMSAMLARMSDIHAANQVSLDEIVALGNKSKEISKVMVIINAVADQTKLIAFNAALEACSAGDAGRRFGVVAAEIRRLADSVTESTAEIEAKISEIQHSISRLVITSEKGATGIVEGMDATASTAHRLDELVAAASQTSSAAQQISLSTQQQKSASSQVVLALREIVNANADTNASIGRIASISDAMNDMSSKLSTLVGQFRLARRPEAS